MGLDLLSVSLKEATSSLLITVLFFKSLLSTEDWTLCKDSLDNMESEMDLKWVVYLWLVLCLADISITFVVMVLGPCQQLCQYTSLCTLSHSRHPV